LSRNGAGAGELVVAIGSCAQTNNAMLAAQTATAIADGILLSVTRRVAINAKHCTRCN
jgi:hypothetical protein